MPKSSHCGSQLAECLQGCDTSNPDRAFIDVKQCWDNFLECIWPTDPTELPEMNALLQKAIDDMSSALNYESQPARGKSKIPVKKKKRIKPKPRIGM